MWLYGSGFPKSMNIGLTFDKKEGLQGQRGVGGFNVGGMQEQQNRKAKLYIGSTTDGSKQEAYSDYKSDLAKQWKGWGTQLKPSYEPIIVARKPFKGSLADNVIEYGVGGINIDECRVKAETNRRMCGSTEKSGETSFILGARKETYTCQGRFPANTILTYDDTDYDEVCGGFPNSKSHQNFVIQQNRMRFDIGNNGKGGNVNLDNTYQDSGSVSRYFMNCKYTGKDEKIWKQLLVNNVESNLEILKATKDNIAQMSVRTLLKELKDHYAKYVGNQLDLTETPIVQDIVEMLTWDFKIETSQVIQDFITNSKKCIQFLNLVQFVEKMDNIDTTQTTQNLLKLFGYVKVVITNYIQGNIEYDQKRYIYTPKASKKDRDEGLEDFDEVSTGELQGGRQEGSAGSLRVRQDGSIGENPYAGNGAPKKNIHPTVKPTELMQYLIRLVSPKGATILDPFMGSGSTGKAVMFENKERNANYDFIGIEKEKEYCEIAEARIKWAENYKEPKENENQIDFEEYLMENKI